MRLKEKLRQFALLIVLINLVLIVLVLALWGFHIEFVGKVLPVLTEKNTAIVLLLVLSGAAAGLTFGLVLISLTNRGSNGGHEIAKLNEQLIHAQRDNASLKKKLKEVKDELKLISEKFNSIPPRKQLEADLEQKKYFLEKTQQTAQIGYWIFDLSKEKSPIVWSKETCRIFGLHENEFDGKFETFLAFVHPDDKDKFSREMQHTMGRAEAFNIDHRIVKRNGNTAWVNEQAEVVRDENGKTHRLIGMVQDITHRKAIEEVLREFNERYEILSKATNDVIWDWSVTSNTVLWNHGLQTIFNYDETEIEFTLEWWREKVHPEDIEGIMQNLEKAFGTSHNKWSHTYRFRCSDGTYKYVYDRAYIIYDANQPVRMIGSMQDISERMRAHEEIEKLSFVASRTDNAVMITDADQRIEWVNEGFVKMTGYTIAETKSRTPEFLYGPETNLDVVRHMLERISKGETFSGELVNYSKTGRKYWLKFNITPVFRNDGSVKNFIFMQSDISSQREFEDKITAIARELESLIENANVPIFGIDRNGYINEWNKVTAELCGFTKSEVFGRKWIEEMVTPDHHGITSQMLAKVLWGNPAANFELPVFTKNKKRLILLLSATPRRDANKNITGAILVAQDITELIEYRQNLEKMVEDRTRALNNALQKEKELVDLKGKFVSIASHEFRTPLSTISLASGYLKKYRHKLSPEEFDRKLDNIEKQVLHMTHLLDDVLMIGKAEAGKIQVRVAEVDFGDFIEKICAEIEQITGHSHRIRIHTALAVERILSDEKLLRNISINLLTNAIKFSPGAGVVDLDLLSDAGQLSIKIRDYGIGIPAAELENIFEPFYRGSNVNAIQGTGLGLSIIKKAVDLLQGSIHIKSDMGKGTELTVFLPIIHE